jgi:hypothetical protein
MEKYTGLVLLVAVVIAVSLYLKNKSRSNWSVRVELGTFKNVSSLRDVLEKKGYHIGSWADDILNKITLSKSKHSVEVYFLTLADLGLESLATTEEIVNAATKLGYKRPVAEVAPLLLLQHPEVLSGYWSVVMHKPIVDSDGDPALFYLDHDLYGYWLNAFFGYPGKLWHRYNRFVFCK